MPSVPTPHPSSGPVATLRPAVEADAEAIAAIYNDAVVTTTATFDTEARSLAAQREWLAEHHAPYVVLVAVAAARVVGWASLSPWSDRRAYAETAEVSEYVGQGHRGAGVGTALLDGLIVHARSVPFHMLLARIADSNPASHRLHASRGFRVVGVMHEVGLKFGRRIDVALLELRLSAIGPAPMAERRQS